LAAAAFFSFLRFFFSFFSFLRLRSCPSDLAHAGAVSRRTSLSRLFSLSLLRRRRRASESSLTSESLVSLSLSVPLSDRDRDLRRRCLSESLRRSESLDLSGERDRSLRLVRTVNLSRHTEHAVCPHAACHRPSPGASYCVLHHDLYNAQVVIQSALLTSWTAAKQDTRLLNLQPNTHVIHGS
jgi:hypothetical protein